MFSGDHDLMRSGQTELHGQSERTNSTMRSIKDAIVYQTIRDQPARFSARSFFRPLNSARFSVPSPERKNPFENKPIWEESRGRLGASLDSAVCCWRHKDFTRWKKVEENSSHELERA